MIENYVSDILSKDFLSVYVDKQPKWDGLGYIVYKRSYARPIYDEKGNFLKTEEYWQTIARAINGSQKIGAQYTKEEAEKLFSYIFDLKCNFAGRSLWQLNTSTVERFGANSLINCFYASITKLEDFCFIFENLMLGSGVGFSVKREHIHELPRIKSNVIITHEKTKDAEFIVPDSRRGWIQLLRNVLDSFFNTGKSFNYSTILVREYGEIIRGFGGTASGPGILIRGMENICKLCQAREGKKLRSIDVLDIVNSIGAIVVAGNVRRSSQIALGDADDYLYLRAKRWDLGNLPAWRGMSNNSIYADDFDYISDATWDSFAGNGEAIGLFNLELSQSDGRLGEKINDRADGANPCQPKWAKLLTKDGIKQLRDVNVGDEIWSTEGWTKVRNKINSGVKKVYCYRTGCGAKFYGTKNHKVLYRGDKIEVDNTNYIDCFTNLGFDAETIGISLNISQIIERRFISEEDVFDITVDNKSHTYWTEGCNVSNCGEISLESYESCVSYTTPIITRKGLVYIGNSVGKEIEVWNGNEWSSVVPTKTGDNRELYRVYFSDGSFLDCTDTHKFSIADRFSYKKGYKEVRTKDLLQYSKYLVHSKPFSIKYNDGEAYKKDAYTLGFAVGDGFVDKNCVNIILFGDKVIKCPVKGKRSDIKQYIGYNVRHQRVNCTKYVDLELVRELKYNHLAFDKLFTWNRNSILNFIAGLIDSDGSETVGFGVRLYVSHYFRALKLQLLLTKCGISSSVNLCQKKGKETNFSVRTKDLYYLQITNCNLIPCHRVDTSNGMEPAHKGKFQIIKRVEKLEGFYSVYCFTEKQNHMAVFSNVLTYQCNLAELYLNNIESKEELFDCTKLLYKTQKAIASLNYLHKETTEVVHRNFRLGLGVTGICQSFDKLDWLDGCYRQLKKFDKEWSKKRGWNESLKLTTVKPSGSLSLLASATPGVHPAYSGYYIRRVQMSATDKLVDFCKNQGYNIEYLKKLDGSIDHETVIVEFPCMAGKNAKTAKEMTSIEQLELVKKMQTIWSDNAVSCTIYYKEDELKQIKEWLAKNYKKSIKSVSFLLYKSHGFQQAPYEEITYEKYQELQKNIKPIKRIENIGFDSIRDVECQNGSCPIK